MRRLVLALGLIAANATSVTLAEGVNIGEPSKLRNLVPAKQIEQSAAGQYAQMLKQADAKHESPRESWRPIGLSNEVGN